MDAAVAWTVLSGVLILVGIAGIVVPILPGSAVVALGLLVWALAVGRPVGWIVFGIGLLLVVSGMLAGTLLTGRVLRERRIPGWSILAGLALGVVGFFVVPVVGLLLGFVVGLFLSELVRQRNPRLALSSSAAALKATGLGLLVEFGCSSLAAGTWVAGVWIYFATR